MHNINLPPAYSLLLGEKKSTCQHISQPLYEKLNANKTHIEVDALSSKSTATQQVCTECQNL